MAGRRQSEDRFALALCIGVQCVRLNRRAILYQSVENVHGFPDVAWDKGGEQRDVAVSDVMVRDAAIPHIGCDARPEGCFPAMEYA